MKLCPHCLLTHIHYEGRIERCYVCGYWNDPLHPLRYATEQDEIDTRARYALSIECEGITAIDKGGRPKRTRKELTERKRIYNREYRLKHKERLDKQKNDKYKAYQDGEHFGVGRVDERYM